MNVILQRHRPKLYKEDKYQHFIFLRRDSYENGENGRPMAHVMMIFKSKDRFLWNVHKDDAWKYFATLPPIRNPEPDGILAQAEVADRRDTLTASKPLHPQPEHDGKSRIREIRESNLRRR